MGARGTAVLSPRALNRALLDRQLLLGRAGLDVVAATGHLFGLNAQSPDPPYLALWSRLDRFTIEDLTTAIETGSLVRSVLMRATQHLVPAADFRLVRPVLALLLKRVQRNVFGRRTTGIELDDLVTEAAELLSSGKVLTRPELGRALARTRPGADATALGWTVQYLLPVVHPAPSGTWGKRGATPFAAFPGLPEATAESSREMVRRYLAAFGPATVADARTWSGVSGLPEIFEQLRPELRTYADKSGRELFDLRDRELPPADLPAPVRLLPEFDATLLAYADRTRVMADPIRRQVCQGDAVAATVLVDGTVAATWTKDRTGVLTVVPLRSISAADREAIEAEALRLLEFAAPGAVHDIRFNG